MSYNQRNRTIQLSLVVFCCLFVTVFRGEVSVNSETCIVPHLAPPPKFFMVQKPASCSADR